MTKPNLQATSAASILVVDDELRINDFICDLLSASGYQAEAALTGEEALAILGGKTPDRSQKFDLVLLDIMLPGLDGYEVCRRLKADPVTQDLSIIMLTAMGKVADKVRGLELGADDYIPKPFDNMELIARVRAVLRLRKAEQELRRRNQALGAINAVAEAVGNAVELADVIDTALDTTLSKLELKTGAITLGHSAEQQTIAIQHAGAPPPAAILEVAGQSLQLGQPYTRPLSPSEAAPGSGALHLACAPLRAHNRLSGTLLVGDERPIDADMLDVLAGIGLTLGAAIERARLYEAAQQRSEDFAVLNDLSRIISSSLDLEEVFTGAVRGIREFMHVEVSALALLAEKDDQLTFRKILSRDQQWRYEQPLSPEAYPLIHHVIQARDLQIVDSRSDPAFVNPLDAITGITTRTAMVVPLIAKGRCIGAIETVNKIGGGFLGTDIEMVQFLTASVAVALENARLYSELAASTRELERSQAQLVQAEKLTALGRMAASIAHEVNNPLQSISNCLHLVIQRPLTDEKKAHYLEMASEEVNRLINIVSRTLDFYRPSKGRVVSTDVNNVVESVLALAGKRLEHGRVRVRRHLSRDLPALDIIPDQLTQVFLNLVINAIEAMPDGGNLNITSHLADDGWVHISFADTGPGLATEDMDKVFEPFFTTKVTGTGLGLAISHGIIDRMGGRITIASTPGQGATFTVSLPAQAVK